MSPEAAFLLVRCTFTFDTSVEEEASALARNTCLKGRLVRQQRGQKQERDNTRDLTRHDSTLGTLGRRGLSWGFTSTSLTKPLSLDSIYSFAQWPTSYVYICWLAVEEPHNADQCSCCQDTPPSKWLLASLSTQPSLPNPLLNNAYPHPLCPTTLC